MEPEIAHRIASQNHGGQRNRFGDRVIEHLERVAATVPPAARAAALLRELLELCPMVRQQLLRGASRAANAVANTWTAGAAQ